MNPTKNLDKPKIIKALGFDEIWTRFYLCPRCEECNLIRGFKFCPDCGLDLKGYEFEKVREE